MLQEVKSHTKEKQEGAADSLTRRSMPCNVVAEQVLLGAILLDNSCLNKISDFFLATHLSEPIHQRIYEAIIALNDKGLTADPVTLGNYFYIDQALVDIGGSDYLHRLVNYSNNIINILDYARIIYDLYLRRHFIHIGQDMVNLAYDSKIDEAANTQIERAENELFHLASEGSVERQFVNLKDSISMSLERIENAYKNHEGVVGTPTGFKDLDNLLGGMQNSDLIILAGRPSMGKTALAVNIALQSATKFLELSTRNTPETAINTQSVGVFSLEMSEDLLASRLISMSSDISSGNIRSGIYISNSH